MNALKSKPKPWKNAVDKAQDDIQKAGETVAKNTEDDIQKALGLTNEEFEAVKIAVELIAGLVWGYFLLKGEATSDIYQCLYGEISIIMDLFKVMMDVIHDLDDGDVRSLGP